MQKTIKAKYHDGIIETLEKIDIADSSEITVLISDSDDDSQKPAKQAKATMGSQKKYFGIWVGSSEEYETILKAIRGSKSNAEF